MVIMFNELKAEELLNKYNKLIPEIYSENNFPKNFSLAPLDWVLTDQEIEKNKLIKINGKKIRPLLTMDLEFLSNDIVKKAKNGIVDLVKNYPCGLKCPGCFSQEDVYNDKQNLMKWQEVMKIIDEARELGLKSIKFLGPGEMFQNPDLFNILDALKERKLPISIFTKGAELGDDALAKKIFSSQGINTAKELVNKISEYKNVRILLGFNSFSSQRQDMMVGSLKKPGDYIVENGIFTSRGISNYTQKRDNALLNLVESGFNKKEQKLSLIAAPVFYYQIDEIPQMYLWAAKRNIPLVIAPTMESGPKAKALQKANKELDPEHKQLINLMVEVYKTAIDNGVLTIEKIKKEGISAYMGTSPCNQVANGLFMRLNGQIQMCPGKSDIPSIYGNINSNKLINIWTNSPNYNMGPLKNNWCTAKTNGMPKIIQEEVMKILEKKYSKKKR